MTVSFYKGLDTYVIYAEDSAFGTAGTPTGSSYVDKVTSFSANLANNFIKSQGIGEGRNATNIINGNLDCSGSMEWELTDPDFLQYCFIGNRSGAGTAADPYEIQEVDEIGYGSGQVNTLTLEVGSNGGSNDDVMTYDGVVINSFSVSANLGEVVTCSADWIGRTVTSSTTTETYTKPSNRPFSFIDGSVTVDSDTVGELTSISLSCNNNIYTHRAIGSRLIRQPVAGIRRYEFSFTMKLHYNDGASVLSALEARGIVFSGVTSATTPTDTAENTAVAVSFDLAEGSSTDDRVVHFDFENCYFESISSPVQLDEGAIEVTINGVAQAGLTDGSEKVPCRWWTIS